MDLTELFRSVILLSLLGSILAIAIFLIKLLLRGKLSANWHYYIWFFLVFRLLIPLTPDTPLNVLNLVPHHSQDDSLPKQMLTPTSKGATSSTLIKTNPRTEEFISSEKAVKRPETFSGKEFITVSPVESAKIWFNRKVGALVWLIGIAVITGYIIFINTLLHYRTKKLPRCDSKDLIRILQECKSSLNIKSKVSIFYDDSLKSPAILGFLAPQIIISPQIVKLLSPDEMRYILMHELSHLKRRDLQINGIVLIIQVFYWFNPIIWYALRQMKQDCEIACDATALTALKLEEHKKYGQTIIRLMELLSQPRWAAGTLGFVSKFNTRRIVMISNNKKTTIKWAVAALALTLLAGCASIHKPVNSPQGQENEVAAKTNVQQKTSSSAPKTTLSSTAASNSILYNNPRYGFQFTLPLSWKGYLIIDGKWDAYDVKTGKNTETGPMISIRHPEWTSQNPRQDVPILVFSLGQWKLIEQGKIHIGAAPIGPTELGRNDSYVFALPARYNYAFPTGYKEVEKILGNHPLKPIPTTKVTDPKIAMLLSMMNLAKQGKVINCEFPAKTSTIETFDKAWGKADRTDYVAAAKGRYATYLSHNVVVGINKGEQIFEVRSFDSQLKGITLAQVKEAFGTPALDHKAKKQEIVGYTAGKEFKIEMVFPQPTSDDPNPMMDHYNVLYPLGTVNSMADDPGRQW